MRARLVPMLAFALGCVACAKKAQKSASIGASIGAPQVQPPVASNLPDAIEAGGDLQLDVDASTSAAMMSALKDYLQPTGGFIGPVQRLGMIDSRMADLDGRAKESPRACLSETARAFTPAATMGDGTPLVFRLQCQEDETAPTADTKENQIAFAVTSDDFYLVERTYATVGSGILVFVTEPRAGDANEVWELRYKATDDPDADGLEAATWLHVKSSAGAVELTTAGSSTHEGALSCGMQMRSSKKLVYVSGAIATGGQCGEEAEYCADAETLAPVETGECDKAGLTTLTLTPLTQAGLGVSLADAKALAEATIVGFTDFKTDQ